MIDLYINRHHNLHWVWHEALSYFSASPHLLPPTLCWTSLCPVSERERHNHSIPTTPPSAWQLRVESTLIPATAPPECRRSLHALECLIKHPRASHYYIISSLTWIIYPLTPRCTHSPISVVWFLLLLLLSWLTAGQKMRMREPIHRLIITIEPMVCNNGWGDNPLLMSKVEFFR